MAIKHKKVSTIPDGEDTSLVLPSDWNDTHDIENGTITDAMLVEDYALASHSHSGVYANASHGHTIADVTNLQTALDGKASVSHSHTKADVGLGNVDNTSDANKPVSTATQTALDSKAATTHNHDGTYAAAAHTHAFNYQQVFVQAATPAEVANQPWVNFKIAIDGKVTLQLFDGVIA